MSRTQILVDALTALTEPVGAYSRDHLTHANNTIENTIEVAKKALADFAAEPEFLLSDDGKRMVTGAIARTQSRIAKIGTKAADRDFQIIHSAVLLRQMEDD